MKEDILNELKELSAEEFSYERENKLTFFQKVVERDFFRYQEERIQPYCIFLAAFEVYAPFEIHSNWDHFLHLKDRHFFDYSMEINAVLDLFKALSHEEQKEILQLLKKSDVSDLIQQLGNITEGDELAPFQNFLAVFLGYIYKTETEIADSLILFEFVYLDSPGIQKALDLFEKYCFVSYHIEHDDFSVSEMSEELSDGLQQHYNAVLDYTRSLESESKNSRKKFIKRQNVCRQLISKIEKMNFDYLSLTDDEILYLPTSLLEKIERLYLKHNRSLMNRVQKELDLYNGNIEIQMKKVFDEYAFPFFQKEEYKSIILPFDLDEIREKLSLLKKMNAVVNEEQLFLCLCFDVKDLERIATYVYSGVFHLSFVLDHLSFFSSEKMNLIQKNMNYLRSYSMSLKGLDAILFLPEEQLERKMKLFSFYQLSKEMFPYIFESYFFDVYDLWIEMGIADYFEQNIEALKNDFVGITKRIYLSLKLKMPIFNGNGTLNSSLLSENKFFLTNEELDFYIGNVSSYFINEEEQKQLDREERDVIEESFEEEYYESPLTYQVQGIVLSRPRVLRNAFVTQKMDTSSYLYGSIHSLEECKKIQLEMDKNSSLKREKKN